MKTIHIDFKDNLSTDKIAKMIPVKGQYRVISVKGKDLFKYKEWKKQAIKDGFKFSKVYKSGDGFNVEIRKKK